MSDNKPKYHLYTLASSKGGPTDLKYVYNDQKRIENVLKEKFGFDVFRGNEDQSSGLVLEEFRQYIAEIDQNADVFIFYYSGHGAVRHQKLYLYTNKMTQNDDVVLHGIPASSIIRYIEAIRVRHKMFIFDCCNAAAAGTKGDISKADIEPDVLLDSTSWLYASEIFRQAREMEAFEGSFLTTSLFAYLKTNDLWDFRDSVRYVQQKASAWNFVALSTNNLVEIPTYITKNDFPRLPSVVANSFERIHAPSYPSFVDEIRILDNELLETEEDIKQLQSKWQSLSEERDDLYSEAAKLLTGQLEENYSEEKAVLNLELVNIELEIEDFQIKLTKLNEKESTLVEERKSLSEKLEQHVIKSTINSKLNNDTKVDQKPSETEAIQLKNNLLDHDKSDTVDGAKNSKSILLFILAGCIVAVFAMLIHIAHKNQGYKDNPNPVAEKPSAPESIENANIKSLEEIKSISKHYFAVCGESKKICDQKIENIKADSHNLLGCFDWEDCIDRTTQIDNKDLGSLEKVTICLNSEDQDSTKDCVLVAGHMSKYSGTEEYTLGKQKTTYNGYELSEFILKKSCYSREYHNACYHLWGLYVSKMKKELASKEKKIASKKTFYEIHASMGTKALTNAVAVSPPKYKTFYEKILEEYKNSTYCFFKLDLCHNSN